MNAALSNLHPICRLLAGWLLAFAFCVTSAHATTSQEKLFAELSTWAAAQNNASPEQVQISPLDARVQVQACTDSISFDYPFANHDSVRARCTKPAWQLFLKLKLSKAQNTVVASHALTAGQLLTEADLELRADFTPAAGVFNERTPVIGRQLKRALAKGQTILAQDLESTLQTVRLRQAMRAGEVITDASVERLTLQRAAASPTVWLGSSLPPGIRLARDVQAGQVLQSSDLAESRQVVVAGSNLAAGQTLKPGLLKLEAIEQDKLTRTHLFEMSGLEGSELIRAVRAGEAIRSADLRPALLIKKGELVLFSVGKASEFQVSIRLEALQDGRLGEQIKLRNSESGRTLTGIVSGQGTARGM